MNYTAVIRTLGKAGEKYQTLLESLDRQTIQPSKILVYIAEVMLFLKRQSEKNNISM